METRLSDRFGIKTIFDCNTISFRSKIKAFLWVKYFIDYRKKYTLSSLDYSKENIDLTFISRSGVEISVEIIDYVDRDKLDLHFKNQRHTKISDKISKKWINKRDFVGRKAIIGGKHDGYAKVLINGGPQQIVTLD